MIKKLNPWKSSLAISHQIKLKLIAKISQNLKYQIVHFWFFKISKNKNIGKIRNFLKKENELNLFFPKWKSKNHKSSPSTIRISKVDSKNLIKKSNNRKINLKSKGINSIWKIFKNNINWDHIKENNTLSPNNKKSKKYKTFWQV